MIIKIFIPVLPAPILWNTIDRPIQAKNPVVQKRMYAYYSKSRQSIRWLSKHKTQDALMRTIAPRDTRKELPRKYPTPQYKAGLIDLKFTFPKRSNFRDPDKCISAAKPYIDGLQDGGLIKDDSNLEFGKIERFSDPDPRKQGVEITFDSDGAQWKDHLGEQTSGDAIKRCGECGRPL